jgi:hypothetical protein
MSRGMESVFTGSNGGPAGIGSYDADPDMRNFVLGAPEIVPGAKDSPTINGS